MLKIEDSKIHTIFNWLFPVYLFILITFKLSSPVHDKEVIGLIGSSLCFFLFITWQCLHGKRVVFNTPVVIALIYLVIITLSYMFLTTLSSMSYRPLFVQYIGVFTFISMYYLIKSYDRLIVFVTTGTSIMCILWVINTLRMDKFHNWDAWLFHRNVYGMLIALTIFPCIDLFYSKSNKLRLLSIINTIAMIAGLYFSGCRGALLSVFIGGVVYLIKERKLFVVPVLAVILFAVFAPIKGKANPVRSRIKTVNPIKFNKNVPARAKAFPKFITLAMTHPITGVGIGEMNLQGNKNNCGPHNIYLFLHGCGGGFALIIALIAIVYVILKPVDKKFLPLKYAVFVWFFYGWWSELACTALPNIVVFMTYLAIICSAGEYKDYKKISYTTGVIASLIASYLFLISVVFSINHYRCNILMLNAVSLNNRGKFEGAAKCALRIIELEPRYYKAHYLMGSVLINLGDYCNSKVALQNCDRLAPDFGRTREILKQFERVKCE